MEPLRDFFVRRIVEAHDARPDDESQAGRGCTFSFEHPLAHLAAA
jgi:hypothetical protein